MVDFKVPYYSRAQIRERAEAFLHEHHPSRSVPIHIELIVERMGIDIVPVPNLQAVYDVDAYTTSDLREIHVDEGVYLTRIARYRFSLAHEVGHIRLHGDLFRGRAFKSGEEWKFFISSISDEQYGYLEFQANEFAGQVLLPLKEMLQDVERCKATILQNAPEVAQDPDAYREFVAACLAQRYEVSPQTARIRMDNEQIVIA